MNRLVRLVHCNGRRSRARWDRAGLLELLAAAPASREGGGAAAARTAATLPRIARGLGPGRWPALRPALAACAAVDAPGVRAEVAAAVTGLATALGPALTEAELMPLLDVRPAPPAACLTGRACDAWGACHVCRARWAHVRPFVHRMGRAYSG
jgi:hypothetical protein